jgi:hypothetical protein
MTAVLVPLALLLSQQAHPLEADALKTRVTLSLKRTIMSSFLDEIRKKTGVRFLVNGRVMNRKITVFAKDKPARDVLEQVEDVFAVRFIDMSPSIMMADTDDMYRFPYAMAEWRYMFDQANLRLNALAAVVRRRPFDGILERGRPELKFHEGTPAEWAERAAQDPLYYAMGCWWSMFPVKRFDFLMNGSGGPHYFKVDTPLYPMEQKIGAVWGMIPYWEPLRGAFIAVRFHMDTGEWRPVWVDTGEWPAKKDKVPPYRFARPPKALAGLPFAKRVLAWPTEIPKELNEVELADEEAAEAKPEFAGGRVGLAEFAEEIHRRTGRTVVADDFRLPMLEPPTGKYSRLGPYLEHLRDKCDVFVKVEGNDILLRHPAFWMLELFEPDERATLRIEAASARGRLTLADYVNYAEAFLRNGTCHPRFETPDRMLVRFNARPLREALPALVAIATFKGKERESIFRGETFDDRNVNRGTRPGHNIDIAAIAAVHHRHDTDPLYFRFLELSAANPLGKAAVFPNNVGEHLRQTGRWDGALGDSRSLYDPYHTMRIVQLSPTKFSIRFGLEGYAVTSYVTDLDPNLPEEGKEDDD